MTTQISEVTPRRAALIAGVGYVLIFVLAVFANFVVIGGLIESGDAVATAENLQESEGLFRAGLVALLVVGVAWLLVERLRGEGLYGFDADSAVLVRESSELGRGVHLLLPGLDRARVVVPARPHDPREFRDAANRARLNRRQSFFVSTNWLGTRGEEPSRDPQDFLILCVGDSVTFGWGYDDHESYPALLAETLGVEVVNAGVPALKPAKVAGWIQLLKQELPVDLVLFSARPDMMNPEKWVDYKKAVEAAARAASPAPLGIVLAPQSTFDAQDPAHAAAEAQRVTEMVRPLLVLDLTEAFRRARPDTGVILERQGTTQRLIQLPERKVLLEAQQSGGGVHPDIRGAFDADTSLVEALFFDGGHPDRAGLELFADEVAAWVRAQGWLPEE